MYFLILVLLTKETPSVSLAVQHHRDHPASENVCSTWNSKARMKPAGTNSGHQRGTKIEKKLMKEGRGGGNGDGGKWKTWLSHRSAYSILHQENRQEFKKKKENMTSIYQLQQYTSIDSNTNCQSLPPPRKRNTGGDTTKPNTRNSAGSKILSSFLSFLSFVYSLFYVCILF